MNARPWFKTVGFELAVLALIELGIVGLIRGASGSDAPDAMAASPAGADDYHHAADHLTALA